MDEPKASMSTTILVLAASIASSSLLTGWIEASTATSLRGRVASHETVVHAESVGRVRQLLAKPGTVLRPGDPLCIVASESEGDESSLAREVDRLEAELVRTRARVDVEVAWRQREIDREILETELRAADLLRQKFDENLRGFAWGDLAESVTVAFRTPADASPVVQPITTIVPRALGEPLEATVDESTRHLEALLESERARNAAEVTRAQLELCESRLDELRSLRTRLPEEIEAAHGMPRLVARRESVAQQLERLEGPVERTIAATGHGVIDGWNVKSGDRVDAGSPLISVVDRARTYVELPIPSASLAAYPPEAAVEVRFPGGVDREGRIVDRPGRAVVRESDRHDPRAESFVLVRIEPVGKLWPEVPLGTTVEIKPAATH